MSKPTMKELINKAEQYIFPTYIRSPIVLTKGEEVGVFILHSKTPFVSGWLSPPLSHLR